MMKSNLVSLLTVYIFSNITHLLAVDIETLVELRENGFEESEILELSDFKTELKTSDYLELIKNGFSKEFTLELRALQKKHFSAQVFGQDEQTEVLEKKMLKSEESFQRTIESLKGKKYSSPGLFYSNGIMRRNGYEQSLEAPRRDAPRMQSMLEQACEVFIEASIVDVLDLHDLIEHWIAWKTAGIENEALWLVAQEEARKRNDGEAPSRVKSAWSVASENELKGKEEFEATVFKINQEMLNASSPIDPSDEDVGDLSEYENYITFEYPENLPQKVKDVFRGLIINHNKVWISQNAFIGKFIGLYFAAPSWCKQSKEFSETLNYFYDQNFEEFELLFLSLDKNKDNQFDSLKSLRGYTFEKGSSGDQFLKNRFKVSSTPRLIVLSPFGEVITQNGCKTIKANPNNALNYWKSQALKKPIVNQ